jgi:3-oxoadipate enol-lactonase/4-carboxymuconolactone decarboxylase
MTVGTVELAYRFDGPADGPVLLLSNSLGTSIDMWEPQTAPLGRFFRVLRYDHRGHGASPSAPGPYSIDDLGGDVVALLDRLGIERVSMVGLSLGGMVTMWLATHHPDRVDRIVLCCTAAYLGPPDLWPERARIVRSEGTSALTATLLGRWFTPEFAASHPEVLERVATMLAGVDAEGYAGCSEAIGAMDQRGAVGAIVAPTLVLSGADDPVVPPPAAVELSRAIPGASLVVIGRAAHLANLEQPTRFTEALLQHLTGSPFERGLAVRRSALGDEYVDGAFANATDMTAPFQELVTELAWGAVWARPHLDLATRRLVTIAALVTLGRVEELQLHTRAALAAGVSPVAVREVLMQCAVYAGVPAANSAFRAVAPLLDAAAAAGGTAGGGTAGGPGADRPR